MAEHSHVSHSSGCHCPVHRGDGASVVADRSWPELGEELSRKALETLETAVFDFGEGTITSRELWIITGTLVDTIMGLVPMEVTNMILAVRKDVRD